MKIAQETNDIRTKESALIFLSNIYSDLGDYRQQVEVRIRQVEITRQQNDKFSEASALIVLASNYNDHGEHQKAAETYQQALAVARQIEIEKLLTPSLQDNALATEVDALQGLTLSCGALGKHDKATDFAQQALKVAQTIQHPKLEAEALLQLAFLYYNTFWLW